MKKFVVASLISILLVTMNLHLNQIIAQTYPTATSTAFIPNSTEVYATLTVIPTLYPDLSEQQQRALQNLIELGSVEYLPDGSIQSHIMVTETWLNDRLRLVLPLVGLNVEDVSVSLRRDGVTARINQNGNNLVVHGGVNLSNHVPVAHFDWATYNGTSLELSTLTEQETLVNYLLALQTSSLLSGNIFSYRIDRITFHLGYAMFEANLRFRE